MPKYPYNSIFHITQELTNSPAFKMAQELANSPAFKMAQELANSPSVKMAQELANNPAFKMAQELANNPAFKMAQKIATDNSFLQEPQILHTMQKIPFVVSSPSFYSSPFIDQINDITVDEGYVDIPNDLYSAIETPAYKSHVNISPVNDKKSRFSLEFFLSCVLPNIIALWGVLLTIYYHNIDNNKSIEKISKDEYTQILEEAFTSAISSLFERLQINIPASSDILLASPSYPSENLSSAKSDDPVLSDTHEFDNPDMHQSPEQ